MNPEIKRYLDEHGATYAPEALRRQLLEAGYEPAQVDAALEEWTANGADAPSDPTGERQAFGKWAFGLHVGAVVALVALLVLLKGTSAIGMALLAAAVLAIPLLIGWLISSFIGRSLLPRGLVIALVVPAISALVLGGSCFAIMNSSIQPPPFHGSAHLEILAPRSFEGSGESTCHRDAQGVYGVDGLNLGTLDGKAVNVSLFWTGNTGATGIPDESLSIFMSTESETEPPEGYSTIFSTHFEVDAAADRLSGAIQFEGLVAEPGATGVSSLPPISGSFSWTCVEE